jgi:hypothetical protein
MRQILIENAQRRKETRRGGNSQRQSDWLRHTVTDDARKAKLVKLSYFVGLDVVTIAARLGIPS